MASRGTGQETPVRTQSSAVVRASLQRYGSILQRSRDQPQGVRGALASQHRAPLESSGQWGRSPSVPQYQSRSHMGMTQSGLRSTVSSGTFQTTTTRASIRGGSFDESSTTGQWMAGVPTPAYGTSNQAQISGQYTLAHHASNPAGVIIVQQPPLSHQAGVTVQQSPFYPTPNQMGVTVQPSPAYGTANQAEFSQQYTQSDLYYGGTFTPQGFHHQSADTAGYLYPQGNLVGQQHLWTPTPISQPRWVVPVQSYPSQDTNPYAGSGMAYTGYAEPVGQWVSQMPHTSQDAQRNSGIVICSYQRTHDQRRNVRFLTARMSMPRR